MICTWFYWFLFRQETILFGPGSLHACACWSPGLSDEYETAEVMLIPRALLCFRISFRAYFGCHRTQIRNHAMLWRAFCCWTLRGNCVSMKFFSVSYLNNASFYRSSMPLETSDLLQSKAFPTCTPWIFTKYYQSPKHPSKWFFGPAILNIGWAYRSICGHVFLLWWCSMTWTSARFWDAPGMRK